MDPAPSQSQMRTVQCPVVTDTLPAQARPLLRSQSTQAQTSTQAQSGIHGPGTKFLTTSKNVANGDLNTATRLSTAEVDAPPACSPRGIFAIRYVRTSRAISRWAAQMWTLAVPRSQCVILQVCQGTKSITGHSRTHTVGVLTLRLRSKTRHDVQMATPARHMSYVNFLLRTLLMPHYFSAIMSRHSFKRI